MATVKHAAPEADAALTITLDSKANGTYALSSALANDTDLYLFADFELKLGSFTSLAGGYMALYILSSIDGGTDYPDSTVPAETSLAAVFPLTTGASAKVVTVHNVPLPPTDFKVSVGNFSGATTASSGNSLRYSRHNLSVA